MGPFCCAYQKIPEEQQSRRRCHSRNRGHNGHDGNHPRGIAKFIVLEGVARLYLRSVLGIDPGHAGEMMIIRWGATELSNSGGRGHFIDYEDVLLITGFGPLPKCASHCDRRDHQIERESQGQLIETNLVDLREWNTRHAG